MINCLELREIELFYQKRRIGDRISCRFEKGRVNLIVGRAGSGKSTLLRTIAGFHNDFSGKIFADNVSFKPEGRIALAFQNPENLFFNPSVGDEVCYALIQKDDKEFRQKGMEWLEKWGMDAGIFWNKHPLELSGGEKRKVALSACTVLLPDVILLDEPLAGLDFHGSEKLAKIISQIAQDHIVVIVTHDPENLIDLTGRVLFLGDQAIEFKCANEFIAKSLKEPDFYPLPEWYVQAIGQKPPKEKIPRIRADAVFKYLEGTAKDADYLFTG
ncbi:MAG: ABC transporter ATP-binding protein [Candidatus Rifleibacteriota bacterium]